MTETTIFNKQQLLLIDYILTNIMLCICYNHPREGVQLYTITLIILASVIAILLIYRLEKVVAQIYHDINRINLRTDSMLKSIRRIYGLQKKTLILAKSIRNEAKSQDLHLYRQIEALIELNDLTKLKVSGLRGWALSPDAAVLLYKSLLKHRPEVVVELGGGLSTLVVASALKKIGKGKVISIDHEIKYAEQTEQRLKEYDLADFCHVVVAKLQKVKLGDKQYHWYDKKVALMAIDRVDYLIIDGPPEASGKDARFPAVVLLRDVLSSNVTIFLDDYNRGDEQKAVSKWLKLLKSHKLKSFDTEKGTAILETIDD